MKVKELITKLLEENMESEVVIALDEEHTDENGTSKGYAFEIDEVRHWNYSAEIVFTDWRNKK